MNWEHEDAPVRPEPVEFFANDRSLQLGRSTIYLRPCGGCLGTNRTPGEEGFVPRMSHNNLVLVTVFFDRHVAISLRLLACLISFSVRPLTV